MSITKFAVDLNVLNQQDARNDYDQAGLFQLLTRGMKVIKKQVWNVWKSRRGAARSNVLYILINFFPIQREKLEYLCTRYNVSLDFLIEIYETRLCYFTIQSQLLMPRYHLRTRALKDLLLLLLVVVLVPSLFYLLIYFAIQLWEDTRSLHATNSSLLRASN